MRMKTESERESSIPSSGSSSSAGEARRPRPPLLLSVSLCRLTTSNMASPWPPFSLPYTHTHTHTRHIWCRYNTVGGFILTQHQETKLNIAYYYCSSIDESILHAEKNTNLFRVRAVAKVSLWVSSNIFRVPPFETKSV